MREHNEGVSGRDWNHLDNISRFAAARGTGNVSNRTVLVHGPELTVAPRLWEGATTLVNRTTLAEF